MARFLHVLKSDSHSLAVPVIEAMRLDPGSTVAVVLLGDGPAPALPPGLSVRRLGPGDLDYSGFLELLFQADHVVSW